MRSGTVIQNSVLVNGNSKLLVNFNIKYQPMLTKKKLNKDLSLYFVRDSANLTKNQTWFRHI